MPEIRHDPIAGHSVIIAPERAKRTSDYRVEQSAVEPEEHCPFCPGHETETPADVYLAGGSSSWQIRVFPNKYPALAEGHEVIVESPDHHLELADAPVAEIVEVCRTWQARIRHYGQDPGVRSVVIFKNHGPAAGATRAHPHSQLMALPFTPPQLERELEAARRAAEASGSCPWCRALEDAGMRIVFKNRHYAAIAPYAGRFAYETWIMPREHVSHLDSVGDELLWDFAHCLRQTLQRVNRVLDHPPYNGVLVTAPLRDGPLKHYHWRFEIIPRLANVAGFEWASGCYINPVPPEEAAERLRQAGSD